MKLACVVTTPDGAKGLFSLLSGTFEEKLAKAQALGYEGVELMVRDPASLDAEAIKAALHRHGLQVPQIVTGEIFATDGLALVHPDPAVCAAAMQRAQDTVQLASVLDPRIVVNVGRMRGRIDWFPVKEAEAARAQIIDALGALTDYAAPYGVRITLEPANRYEVDFVRSTQEALEVVAEVARPGFGLMLDVFHMNIEDASIEDSLRQARPVLWHIHIADSNRLPPGQGHLDFASIIATLREIGYEGYLSGEMSPRPDPDTAARVTIEYMRQWL
jgi:sugar phosphate isomerase/epimerase